MRTVSLLLIALLLSRGTSKAQEASIWKDPAPHATTFVTVDDGTKLEVLDWGGPGPAIVLLAGSGNTGHVFDDFAPALKDCCHVYAITRRGYGASSQPASGYDNQRLANDILQVLDRLNITRPVLAGHSMAGGEITTLAGQHPQRVAGLAYIDALGDPRDWPASDPAWMALMRKLPPSTPTAACQADRSSFARYRDTLACQMHFTMPEAELHHSYQTNADGSVGGFRSPGWINTAIGDGEVKRDYTGIRVPVVALYEFPRTSLDQLRPDDPQPRNEDERALVLEFAAATRAYMDRWVQNLLRSVPDARLVDTPAAGHYIFLTRPAVVASEIRALAASAKSPSAKE